MKTRVLLFMVLITVFSFGAGSAYAFDHYGPYRHEAPFLREGSILDTLEFLEKRRQGFFKGRRQQLFFDQRSTANSTTTKNCNHPHQKNEADDGGTVTINQNC